MAPVAYRRLAVLGAGGFLGSHLVPALRRRFGAEVVAVDINLDKLAADALAPGDNGVERVQARLDKPGLIEDVVRRCDVVMSLTAICNPAVYNQRPLDVIDANYTDLVPLVKLCAEQKRWLIHFSTCEVYGKAALRADTGAPMPAMKEEETALWLGPVSKERWSYACAKQLLERVIFARGRHEGLPFTIVRPFNVIGPRMDFVQDIDGEGVPRVLASFMGALLKGDDLLLVDGGKQRRSFIYVDDFVDGVLAMLARPEACQGEVFNLGNPRNDTTIAELAETIAAAYVAAVPGARPGIRTVSAQELYGEGYDDSLARIPDITKAKERLGFDPRMPLDEMLPPIIADYRARYQDRVDQAVAVKSAR
ncbi:MAG TPA: NAD-dependent epimerase/dehydratase family protein [Polyangia bacterium]